MSTLLFRDACAHQEWMRTVREAELLVKEDVELQRKAAGNFMLKGREMAPEVLGRLYAQYCRLVNRLYDDYIISLQLQKLPYIKDIILTFVMRVCELRQELQEVLVTDYVFVDSALTQLHLTPQDIEVLVPFHYPLELRPEPVAAWLQDEWAASERRQRAPPAAAPAQTDMSASVDMFAEIDMPASKQMLKEKSVSVVVLSESYVRARLIQQCERYSLTLKKDYTDRNVGPRERSIKVDMSVDVRELDRQFLIPHNRQRLRRERALRPPPPPAPLALRLTAAALIQLAYRAYMKAKREHLRSYKRDLLLGMIVPSYRSGKKLEEENSLLVFDIRVVIPLLGSSTVLKMLASCRAKLSTRANDIAHYTTKFTNCLNIKRELMKGYLEDFENKKARLILLRKDNIMDDITTHIREWFRYWYEGYGMFPAYPPEADGGTILVIRGDFETIEERVIADEKNKAKMKGKTKDMLKAEKEREKMEVELKKEAEKERKKSEAAALVKMRCNPKMDPGYSVKMSSVEVTENFSITALATLAISLDHEKRGLSILELKLLINALKKDYKSVGKKYPKVERIRPKIVREPKMITLDDFNKEKIQILFDKGIVQTAPAVKIKDILGDLNFYAYDYNVKDPDASFPMASYGDVRRRLAACALAVCHGAGAGRRRSVLLLAPPEHGKTFLADTLCGEIGAVKLDISPEVFNVQFARPAKALALVCLAAKLLQPAIIFLRNVERVFSKKVSREDRHFKPKKLKRALAKVLMKSITADDKVMFVATCSDPTVVPPRQLARLFDEVILVPRTDHTTASMYMHTALMSCHGVPRDFNVQPLAQLLQGYGQGTLRRLFKSVMTPERIIRLHVEPLMAQEFLEPLILSGEEPFTVEDYQIYVNWHLKCTGLWQKRLEYEMINKKRAEAYIAMKKKETEE